MAAGEHVDRSVSSSIDGLPALDQLLAEGDDNSTSSSAGDSIDLGAA